MTVLPRYLCAGPLASGELRALLDPPDPPINTLYFATRTGAHAQPHIEQLRHTLREKAVRW